ncbi:MAG: hypothetical protein WC575_02690 [Patescibacteria group bacterium]
MRNYAGKSNKQMTRYRTPSAFKVRKSENTKRQINAPYHPPGRGHRTNIGRA